MNKILLLALVLLALPALAAGEEETKIEASKVAGSVYVVTGDAGNVGVSVGPDGILIVDDQFEPVAGKIVAAIRALPGVSKDGMPRFVLNTHWHGDHTGGNAFFARSGTVLSHSNARRRLAKGASGKGFEIPPAPKEALPIVTFDESLTIHWNGEEILATHVPGGHTDGDSVIRFSGSNVIHMGDLFFNGLLPYIDTHSGGSLEGYLAAVESTLRTLPAGARIIPGHGPVAGRAELETFLRMLKETSAHVRAGLAKGKSVDAVVAAGLPAEWKSWAHPFVTEEAWIRLIAESGKPARKN